MDPAIPDINISDVVVSTTGRDQGERFYVIENRSHLPVPGKRKGPNTGEAQA